MLSGWRDRTHGSSQPVSGPHQTMQEEQWAERDLLWQMDIILPAQYFGAGSRVGLCSEKRLMLAVLVDAINILHRCCHLGSVGKYGRFAETRRWVNTRGTSYLFSFDSICDALEIDSESLRSRLHASTADSATSSSTRSGSLRLNEFGRTHRITANRLRRRVPMHTGLVHRQVGARSRP